MIAYVSGDPLLTAAPVLAFGTNARGRAETDALHVALQYRFPAALASYAKQARAGRIKTGQFWHWRESQPQLLFLAVRETPFGIARARHVEALALTLARDYRLHGLRHIAIAPLAAAHEWPLLRQILSQWLEPSPLSVVVYDGYQPGVAAEA